MQNGNNPRKLKTISFTVAGTPVTQGSKNAYIVGNRAIVVNVNHKKLTAWRAIIALTAKNMGVEMIEKGRGVSMAITFYLSRPRYHYRKNGKLNPAYANAHFAKAPDLSKLVRAAEDALTRVAYYDDSQIVRMTCEKKYSDKGSCVEICINELE